MTSILDHLKTYKDAYLVIIPAFSLLLAFATLIVTNILTIFAERRNAFRKSIEIEIKQLGSIVYEILALIDVYLDKNSPEGEKNWRIKMYKAKSKLSELRPTLRYTLHGVDPGLKALIRSIDWITHIKNFDSDAAQKLVKLTDAIRQQIDDIARYSFTKGRQPKGSQIRKMNKAVKSLKEHYYSTMAQKNGSPSA